MIDAITKRNPQIREAEYKKREKTKKIAKIKKIVGSLIALTMLLGCGYIVLVVAANSSPEESQKWGTNFMISLAQDLGTSQVFKVVLSIILIRLVPKVHNKKLLWIMKKAMDPMSVRALAIVSDKM